MKNSNCSVHLSNIFQFLEEYHWLVDFAVTDILVSDVVSKIPYEWLQLFQKMTFEDAIILANHKVKPEWPSSLAYFFKQCDSLSLDVILSCTDDASAKQKIDPKFSRGLSLKKQHEVESLAELVDSVCHQSRLQGVIDVGSGLGYVDRLLAAKGYCVLGIESEISRVEKAKEKMQVYFPLLSEKKQITYHHLKLNEESTAELFATAEVFIRENDLRNGVCMVGLHTCGDLSSSALKTFLEIPFINSAILIPCCYHKLSETSPDCDIPMSVTCSEDNTCSHFQNFPLSKALSQLMCKPMHKKIFYRPFLRLATQESYTKWMNWSTVEHENNAIRVLSRAVLQYYVKTEDLTLKKRCRRPIKKNVVSDFSAFIEDAIESYNFVGKKVEKNSDGNNDDDGDIKSHDSIASSLTSLWSEYNNRIGLIVIQMILILQMSMQSVAETFFLLDLLSFLQENNIQNLRVSKVFNSEISPRYFALIASKIEL